MRSEMAVTRRLMLRAAAGGLAMATTGPVRVHAEEPESLRKAAAKAGLHFGSASDVDFRAAPPAYAELFIRNCDLFAPLMQWSRTAVRQFDPDPEWEDPNITFAREHGMRLTGGHLLWHETTPSWFDDLPSRAAAEQAAARHIAAMTKRYAPMIYSWNVVNEALEPKDGRPDGLRNSQLLRKLGPDYIATAFSLARRSAPHALLVYNENGLEYPTPDQEAKRTALLRLLDKLQSAETPIDAIGLQAHLRLGSATFNPRIYRDFLREIAGRGLAIIISELDVLDMEFTPAVRARDVEVASLYTAFLDAALDERAVIGVVTWGLVDRYSWLNLWHISAFTRWDRQPTRPDLFDNSLRPKPSFDAVLRAFQNAPPRPHNQFN